jgi:hypothetical protein
VSYVAAGRVTKRVGFTGVRRDYFRGALPTPSKAGPEACSQIARMAVRCERDECQWQGVLSDLIDFACPRCRECWGVERVS